MSIYDLFLSLYSIDYRYNVVSETSYFNQWKLVCYVIPCAARTQNMHSKINFGSYVLTEKEWQQKCVKYNGQTLILSNRSKLCYD